MWLEPLAPYLWGQKVYKSRDASASMLDSASGDPVIDAPLLVRAEVSAIVAYYPFDA